MDLQNRLVYIPTAQLEHHPKNPRAGYSGIEELAESIKAKGVMQNLTVVKADEGKYFVVIGNRRLEAARLAGLAELPCAIAEMTEQEIVSTMLVENIQRSDLTVYEEAQGFQLMLDLGETVSSIAEKTGFSETTVRRRVKLTELDSGKLKKVSDERQVSLGELTKLEEIKDIETRNKLLDVVGTASFNYEFRRAKDEEKREEKEVIWRGLAEKHKLIEIQKSDRWSNKYTNIATAHNQEEFENAVKNKAAFFSPEGSICFMYTKATVKAAKKSKEDIRRGECLEKLDAEFERMYNSRLEFVKNVSESDVKEGTEYITGVIIREVVRNTPSWYSMAKEVLNILHINKAVNEVGAVSKAEETAKNKPISTLFKFAYCLLNDSEYCKCCSLKAEYQKNEKLEQIYDLLETFGYQISDAEEDMLSGKSEMFYRPDPIADQVKGEIRKVFSEDAFDDNFVGKLYELLKSGSDKQAMVDLVSEYAKGKVCTYCDQDMKCNKGKATAKCWRSDEYCIENATDEIAERYRVIKGKA